MGITNRWLNPYHRSYQQIKSKLIEGLSNIADKNGNRLITDYSEGNILVIILSLFAAIAEVLHYYIDNTAREVFLPTARKYDSVVKQGNLVDYHTKSAIAATVDVTLTRSITSENIGANILIPAGTQFQDSTGNTWLSSRDVTWWPNTTTCKVPLIQHELYSNSRLNGIVIPSDERVIITFGTLPNGKYYEHGTLSLKIGGETWALVDTFAYSKPTDKHFMVSVDSSLNPYIHFGDGLNGAKPNFGDKITDVLFYLTNGYNGNIYSGSITTVPAVISSIISDATVSNVYSASGGSNYENFQMMKEHIPLSVKTLGVAITAQDFADLAMLVEGVNKAAVEYECSRKLTVYINPDNGSSADDARIEKVYNLLSQRSPLTTWLKVKTAGTVQIILDIEVTGRKSYKTVEIQQQILTALYNAYSPEKSQIGGKVRISDIYALIDNCSMVDYLHIHKFYTKPWPNTIYGNRELLINNFKLDKASGINTYFITFSNSTDFRIRAAKGSFDSNGRVGNSANYYDSDNGVVFSLGIADNGYSGGFRYSIIISEPNMDYEDPGFNIPVFNSNSQLTLTVKEVI